MELDSVICRTVENDEEFSLRSLVSPVDISLDSVAKLEEGLEFYEKFSLVFLLYDNSDMELAYQKLEVAYTSCCLGDEAFSPISEWAAVKENAGDPNWKDHLVEALCLLQNYKAVQDLGYSRTDTNVRFLPNNLYLSLNVDLMRKALYYVCENLTIFKAEQLIDLVHAEIRAGQSNSSIPPKKHTSDFLELSFLQWHSLEYITMGLSSVRKEIDIQKLIKHLKVLEEEELCDYLKWIAKKCTPDSPATETALIPPASTTWSTEAPSSGHSIVSSYGDSPSGSDMYTIREDSVGLCCIINQKYFYEDRDPNLRLDLPDHKLETRHGTDIDELRLVETFTALGFEVCDVGRDLTHTDIIRLLHSTVHKFTKEHSCFVVCILSHGKKDAVYGSNSIPVEIREIEDIISGRNYPNLFGKPKIIIIQSCQGNDLLSVRRESDIEEDGLPHSRIREEDRTRSVLCDQIKFWSTVPGFASFRHPQYGTWFIEILTSELLKQKQQTDICAIFTNVNRRIGERKTYKEDSWVGMTPQWSSTLTKTLYLPLRRGKRFCTARKILQHHLFNTLLDEYISLDLRKKNFRVPTSK